jgi:hypothetical protein
MAHIRNSSPTILVLLASVVCGCASSPAEHASTAKSPAAVAVPATSSSVLAVTASQAPAAAGASTTADSAALASTTTTSTAAATATAKSADAKVPNADSKVTCHREVPTGSRVSVKVCETEAVRKAREASVRATRDTLSRPTPGCQQLAFGGCAGGGG